MILTSFAIAAWVVMLVLVSGSKETVVKDEVKTLLPTPTPTVTLKPLPTSKILPGGTHVFQTFNNCGPAVLSMALSYYQIKANQEQLGKELRPRQHPRGINDDKSVSFKELAARAEEYGFLAYHRPMGNKNLIINFINNDIPVMVRTLLKPDEDIGHFRLIKGYEQTGQILVQDDSLQGENLRYTIEEMNELWQVFSYEYLVLVPEDQMVIAETILGEDIDPEVAWEKALVDSEREISNNPKNIYAWFNNSIAHYNLKNYPQAVQSFEQVENRLPFRTLWYQIEPIMAYFMLGDYQRVTTLSGQIFNNGNLAASELYYLTYLIELAKDNQPAADENLNRAELYNSTNFWRVNLAPG